MHHPANAEQLPADLSTMSIWRQLTLASSAVLVASLAMAAESANSWVVPMAGDAYAATFAGVNNGTIKFNVGETTKSLPLAGLVRWGSFVEPRRGPMWFLTDGTRIVADLLEFDKDKETLRGRSHLFGKFELPLGVVVGIVVRLPADTLRRDELIKQITTADGDSDFVVLDNGDELSGTLEAVSAESLGIVTTASKVNLELSRVAAVTFNPSLAEKPKTVSDYFALGFVDGSRLVATSVSADLKQLEAQAAGIAWRTRTDALVALQVFSERVKYLSDMEEISFKHVPYLQLAWPLLKDANVRGQPPRVGDKVYLKGLGVHTASRVAYKLDRPYRQFQAEIAIDRSAGSSGSAVCSVYVDDGTGKWQSKYTSPIFRGGEAPLPVRVDLTGVKAISLLCDFADHGDEQDHVDWLDARLVE
jgi:hypothetical protein